MNIYFNFQGFQIFVIRVAISQKGLVELFFLIGVISCYRVQKYGRTIQMFWKPNERTFPIQALCVVQFLFAIINGQLHTELEINKFAEYLSLTQAFLSAPFLVAAL